MSTSQWYDLNNAVETLEGTIDRGESIGLADVSDWLSDLQSEISSVVSEKDYIESESDELEEWQNIGEDFDDVREWSENKSDQTVEFLQRDVELLKGKLGAAEVKITRLTETLDEINVITADELSSTY